MAACAPAHHCYKASDTLHCNQRQSCPPSSANSPRCACSAPAHGPDTYSLDVFWMACPFRLESPFPDASPSGLHEMWPPQRPSPTSASSRSYSILLCLLCRIHQPPEILMCLLSHHPGPCEDVSFPECGQGSHFLRVQPSAWYIPGSPSAAELNK